MRNARSTMTWERGVVLLLVVLAAGGRAATASADSTIVPPFEQAEWSVDESPIDVLVWATLQERGIEPANACSDEVFLRRVYVDVIGTLPEPMVVRRFVADEAPGKRATMIDSLMERAEFADYWALKWCDALRVKAEFPINLWPNGVQAYHRWIRDGVLENKPYDEFVRELLTSSGSNFRVPPVNFYLAVQGNEPAAIAEAVALTFMGSRLGSWPEDRRAGMEALFSRVGFKGTAEWKEAIVGLDPASFEPLDAVLPDGAKVHVQAGDDPRRVFADWLITPENPWFARSVVNRVWGWLLGRGIVHEPDDIRPDNPPVHPKVLDYLAEELVKSGYDLRHICRLILNSRTYQQSSIPQSDHADTEALFAQYPVRRLDAEVLIDALCWITGTEESYSSAIPEPFTFIPEHQRTITLADGSITSQFLEMFGRPARDTGMASERNNEPTDGQRLHMLNSSHIQRKLATSPRMVVLIRLAKSDPRILVVSLYLNILSRHPTQDEVAVAEGYYTTPGVKFPEATVDLAWALINTKEFLYRH